ncbi:hypothetical protein [Gordoniibacillus kamchatkensis]|uniref:hypothetical protein n=1 Tax=Gordoniibacillus kamchatkensis TaxID=1590651 RepID=UPI000ABD28A3|nr:hypothetical protein [Paenibacillus sp. VKM B-2647]
MRNKELSLGEMTREEAVAYLNETMRPEEGVVPAYILGDPAIYKLEHEKSVHDNVAAPRARIGNSECRRLYDAGLGGVFRYCVAG